MDNLLTTKQLMELLHLDRTTIYRMLNDRRLPAVRVGGQWRFSRQAVDNWLERYRTFWQANLASLKAFVEQEYARETGKVPAKHKSNLGEKDL